MTRVPEGIIRGRLSAEERARIEELAETGAKPEQIARRMNRHPGTINFAMHAMGLKTYVPAAQPRKPYVRKGSIVVAFTPEEDAWIEALRIQGYTTNEIARLGEKRYAKRSAATIGVRLMMLGNRP